MEKTLRIPQPVSYSTPQIALRKEDETEYINARTYWSVSIGADEARRHWHLCPELPEGLERTYEIRIKHGGDRYDTIRRVLHDDGDTFTALTDAGLRNRIKDILDHEPDMTVEEATVHANTGTRVISPTEVVIFAHLSHTWKAFATFFNPTTNNF